MEQISRKMDFDFHLCLLCLCVYCDVDHMRWEMTEYKNPIHYETLSMFNAQNLKFRVYCAFILSLSHFIKLNNSSLDKKMSLEISCVHFDPVLRFFTPRTQFKISHFSCMRSKWLDLNSLSSNMLFQREDVCIKMCPCRQNAANLVCLPWRCV